MWRATGGAVPARWISKHADGITWIGQCTQGEERTQTESGFMLSNGRFGVAEPVSELSAYAISTLQRSPRLALAPRLLPPSPPFSPRPSRQPFKPFDTSLADVTRFARPRLLTTCARPSIPVRSCHARRARPLAGRMFLLGTFSLRACDFYGIIDFVPVCFHFSYFSV